MELNYAIFGVGRIGVVHAQIAKSHGCTVVAIGDENSQAISSALEALQMDAEGTETFTSAQEMARACERMAVKFVVVASHTHMHAKHAIAFVDCGLPVYMEKPLTADLSEAFDFCQRVESRAGKSVQIGLQRRFDDALCYAHTLRSEIGVLREIRCVLRDQFPPPPTYTSRSLIVDMGVHVTDEALWFLGPDDFPSEVTARIYHAKEYDSPVDEGGNTAFVTFVTKNGVIGRLDLSRTHGSGYNNELYAIGTRGTLHVGRFAGYPGPIPVELWNCEGKLDPRSRVFEMPRLQRPFAEFFPRFKLAYEAAHEQFRKDATQGVPFRVSERQSLDAQVFTEAAHISATKMNGGPVSLRHSANLSEYRSLCSHLL